ncbi:MAG TPA: hypothetical protein VFW98_01785, partial [Gemmatimonadaceae bacterium]|nr:hypothetical protein [Gemmatimonadaceae bacterium]
MRGATETIRVLALAAMLVAAPMLQAQAPGASDSTATRGAPTPAALGELVMHEFASGTPAAFDSVYPDQAGRAVVQQAVQRHATRRADVSRVVWSGPSRAVLLLGGTVLSESSEDQANRTRDFSGLYEAAKQGGSWMLKRKLPLDSGNHIRAQTLHVALTPGTGIRVTDTLTLSIGSRYGFTARMNGDAQLSMVHLDGRAVSHAFGGNVLWIQSAQRQRAQLVLAYTLREDRASFAASDSAGSSAHPAFGEFNNTDVWHPFFGYRSANDVGRFDITVRVPAAYALTTTLSQTESVRDGIRTVHGHSVNPDFLLSLMYDRDWHPRTTMVDGVRVETFITPDFHSSHDSLVAAFRRVYRVFRPRFGALPSGYVAVVEDRGAGHGGFKVRMNDAVISGAGGKALSEGGPIPGAAFGHEISHAWTMDASGPAANFLREGWATFAESLIVGSLYGPDTAATLREISRSGYIASGEGKKSILGSPHNGQLHYSKGVWIFSMLQYAMGDSAFDRGIRAFSRRAGGPAGYREFIASMSQAAGHDMTGFIMPWLEGKYMPDVHARIDGSRVIFTQAQPGDVFELPLDVELVT